MNRTKFIALRVDSELFDLIQEQPGTTMAQKARKLIQQALKIEAKLTYQQIEEQE